MRTATRARLEQLVDEPKRVKSSQQTMNSTVDFDAAQTALSSNNKRGISPATILRMQQTQGNAAVRRMLAQQPQLSIVQRDDDDDDVNQSVAEPEANQSVEQPESDSSEPVEQAEPVESQPEDTGPDNSGPVDSQPDSSEPNDSENDDTGPVDSQPDSSEPDDTENNDTGPDEPEGAQAVAECSIEPEAEQVAAAGKGCTKVSVRGLTTSGYDHGKPRPPTLPSNATTSNVGKNAIKATGTLDVTYTATPQVTLPKPPATCSDCQQAAVQAFIDTTLAAHEQEHVTLFKDNYDGQVSLPFNFTARKDQVVRALTNVMNKEDRKRANAANAASKAIDPFTRPIPGMDCES